jgi:hypothetical protein
LQLAETHSVPAAKASAQDIGLSGISQQLRPAVGYVRSTSDSGRKARSKGRLLGADIVAKVRNWSGVNFPAIS